MQETAIQDLYADELAVCYGCGRLNEHGLKIKSVWEGEECVARFQPEKYHTGIAGFVYGGLIASLLDCHGIGTAAAAACRARNLDPADTSIPRYVTAALHVDFLRPTPIDGVLEIRGRAVEIKDRKVVVELMLLAHGKECARGSVVAVRMPERMNPLQSTGAEK